MTSFPLVTMTVLAVTLATTLAGARNEELAYKYRFSVEAVLRRKQFYRMVTCALLHGNAVHFAMNALAIGVFGSTVERVLGRWQCLLVYVASIAGGSLLSLYLHLAEEVRGRGASGGTCGLMFASIYLVPGMQIGSIVGPGVPGWLFGAMFLVASYYGFRSQADDIGHDAHIGGAVTGLLLSTALRPDRILAQPLVFCGLLAAALGVMFVLLREPLRHARLRGRRPRLGFHQSAHGVGGPPSPEADPTQALEVDLLLDRISKHGVQSLTTAELEFLKRMSRKPR